MNRGEESKEETLLHFEECFYQNLEESEAREFYNLIKVYRSLLKSDQITEEKSKDRMSKSNPRVILRNYLLHEASAKLENGDSSLFDELNIALRTPYSKEWDKFFCKRPKWAEKKAGCSMLSCSS